jgi:hypothetical protein
VATLYVKLYCKSPYLLRFQSLRSTSLHPDLGSSGFAGLHLNKKWRGDGSDVQIFKKELPSSGYSNVVRLGDRAVEAVAAPVSTLGFMIRKPHLSSCPCLCSYENGRLDLMTQLHHNLDSLVMLPLQKDYVVTICIHRLGLTMCNGIRGLISFPYSTYFLF